MTFGEKGGRGKVTEYQMGLPRAPRAGVELSTHTHLFNHHKRWRTCEHAAAMNEGMEEKETHGGRLRPHKQGKQPHERAGDESSEDWHINTQFSMEEDSKEVAGK